MIDYFSLFGIFIEDVWFGVILYFDFKVFFFKWVCDYSKFLCDNFDDIGFDFLEMMLVYDFVGCIFVK